MIRASITRAQGVREAPCSCEPSCGLIHWEPDGTLTLDISIAGPKDRVDELTAGFLDRLDEATSSGRAAVTSAPTNGVTEGDEIWWCERHQCRWGYAPDCGWSPRGEACRGSRRLLVRVGD